MKIAEADKDSPYDIILLQRLNKAQVVHDDIEHRHLSHFLPQPRSQGRFSTPQLAIASGTHISDEAVSARHCCKENIMNNSAGTDLPWWKIVSQKEFPRQVAYFSPLGQVAITFSCPDVYRLQLRARSCDIWFPQRMVPGLEPAFEFVVQHQSSCPALAIALDASSLCQLGQEHGNNVLWNTGRDYHNLALNLLQRELQPTTGQRNTALVGAICVLQITEAMTSMSSGNSRFHHAKGITALLDGLDCTPENVYGLHDLLSFNFYMFQFWAGLLRRQKIVSFGPFAGSTALSSIAERVPAALEHVDALHKKSALQYHVQVLEILSVMETDLKRWMMSWNPCMRSSPFRIVPSQQLLESEPLIGRKAKNPVPHCLDFNNFVDAVDHCVCTASLLAIRTAMIQVHAALSSSPSHTTDREYAVHSLTASAASCATSLCMAIPFFLKMEHGKYGHIAAIGPLRLVTQWFESQLPNDSNSVASKLEWCRLIAKRIEANGVSAL